MVIITSSALRGMVKEPKSISEMMLGGRDLLNAAGIEAADRNVRWMATEVLQMSRVELIAAGYKKPTNRQVERFRSMIQRRLRREPLQYIVGHVDFHGLRLTVNPSVLIPRPETEGLVDFVLQLMPPSGHVDVLDVGTGSGCIALAIKQARTESLVTGLDVSERALEVARLNSRVLGLDVDWMQSDVLANGLGGFDDASFDVVVSNPPYVPSAERDELQAEVAEFEPQEALFVPGDGLQFYRLLAPESFRVLRAGGLVALEVHERRAAEVGACLKQVGFAEVGVRQDFGKKDRYVFGWKR